MGRLRWTLALGAVLLFSAPSSAYVKPKILIIFDTSGSMLAGGDGSDLCGGAGTASRIYQLKQAFFEVLQGIGAHEVDFALATFPMMMNPGQTPLCYNQCYAPSSTYSLCSGHYYLDPSQESEHSTATTKLHGCKVSTHDPFAQTSANCGAPTNPCAAWYGNYFNEVLKVPFAGSTPEAVMVYFDQKEDPTAVAGPALSNPEVRAGNLWYTPLGKSLFYAHGYFHKEIIPPIVAYERPCSNLVVALFTDGEETCNVNTGDVFYPTKWAANLYNLGTANNVNVVTHTVAIDLAYGGLLQQIATYGKGSYYNVKGNTSALKAAFLDIIAKALPPSEICNGKDDDCDNDIDEDFPLKGQPCDNGLLGVCFKTGTYVCQGGGLVCDAPIVSGTTEICDGLDNNCNGQIDEIPGCIPCAPQPEVCDNKDNDCNGVVDDGVPSTSCGPDLGECQPGTTKCVSGKTICDGAIGPTTEICDNKDNNCDGVIDGMSESCYDYATGCVPNPASATGWDCNGYCAPGYTICTAGAWGSCIGQVGPGTEVCNLLDDDCDGQVDEADDCPTGTKCIDGQCATPCGGGEFVCPKGYICKNDYCVKDPCDAAECGKIGGVCEGGVCIDPCAGKDCTGKYEKCIKGICVDTSCYNPANKCPPGQTCVQGSCQEDPCDPAKVSCAPDTYCVAGQCVPLCDCAADELCKVVEEGGKPVGRCVKDACAGIVCGEGRICQDGSCIEDPCHTVRCDTGEVCIDGSCVADPCETIHCPLGFVCSGGTCVVNAYAGSTDLLATGSGGLACELGPTGDRSTPFAGPQLALAALLLVVALRRRRR